MPNQSAPQLPPHAPLSTYRLQLNLHFTFQDAAEIVPYLHQLGVTDLYMSPYLQARAGSLHGYDISDHDQLNPELGGEQGLVHLAAAVREHGMGQLLDIVPNHMGIGETANRWWMDVLENGPSSPYAPFFDIDWHPLKPVLTGKVLLPVLGDQFGRILENGELRLLFEGGRLRLVYHEHTFPISPRSSALVLRSIHDEMRKSVGEDDPDLIELDSIVTALEHLPTRDRTDAQSIAERRRESIVTRRRLTTLLEESEVFRHALEDTISRYNGEPGDPRSFDELERVLDDQAYRLAYWRVAAEEINYRRFFDVNNLAGVRVERPEVFLATHRLVLRLIAEGKVTSLRVDHPDGLYDPPSYLRHLQGEATLRAEKGPVYILVEKILTGDEQLPRRWPVAGTVGYDFMNRVNGLFVARDNASAFTRIYEDFVGHSVSYSSLIYEKKKLILRVALASELTVLAHMLDRISEQNRRFRDFTLGSLTDALRETIACFPVYRTYIEAVAGIVSPADVDHVNRAVRDAIRRNRATSPSIFEFIRNILLLKWPDELDDDAREDHARFVMKFQQLTGPVTAKGVEDTSFYIYNRLVSLNEVGGEPDRFGIEPDELHEWIRARAADWPLTMNASTTHDSKRSEDVRARINVLSEMPDFWADTVRRWAEMNGSDKPLVDDEPVPDRNDEYLLYQTLIGTWPLERPDVGGLREYRDRIHKYMEKATREAKIHTSWINPNEEFEAGLSAFIDTLLNDGNRPFLDDLASVAQLVGRYGMLNSLAQTVIKLMAPGVPDLYQGQEVWDFSLVDPDNRRPVDYGLRRRMLEEMGKSLEARGRRDFAADLLAGWQDGGIKLFVTQALLDLRRRRPELFRLGEYVPLTVTGKHSRHVFAFARRAESEAVVVVVPRLCHLLEQETGADMLSGEVWEEAAVEVPEGVRTDGLRDVFTEAPCQGVLRVADLLGGFPVAVLAS